MKNRGQTNSYSEQAPPLILPQEVNELPYAVLVRNRWG